MSERPATCGPDFQVLFESAPGPCLVFDSGWNMVAATDAYLQATLTVRDEIIGRYLFDVFPDNPEDPAEESGRNMRASLERVTAGRTDVMPLPRHDVRRPGPDGGFEERYWSPTNTPVFADDGTLRYIMHLVENVTEFVLLRRNAARTQAPVTDVALERMATEIVQRRAEVAEASRQLKESNLELEAQLEQARRLESLGQLARWHRA